jgi:hypothetical protein
MKTRKHRNANMPALFRAAPFAISEIDAAR